MIIAVIGHGPSPAGMGLGPEIDASDLVIRLHDCEWQDRADYGERYDWGVLNRRFPAVLDRIVRRPAMGWLVYHLGGGFAVTPPEPHRIFDLMRWRQRMGVVPTRGLA